MNAPQDIRNMTADTIGKDLLSGLLAELRLLPKPWEQLAKAKQDDVIEGEVLGLPSPDQVKPSDEELDESYLDGYQAAADGKTESDAPVIRHELVAQWMRGFKDWHEQNPADDASNDEKKAA